MSSSGVAATPGPRGEQLGSAPPVEEWLQAAGMLLTRGAHLRAVQVLHREAARALDQSDALRANGPYASRREAQARHRELLLNVGMQRAQTQRGSWLRDVRKRLPVWTSWATVLGVGGGLLLRYAYGMVDRAQWQSEHPEGKWISRYYSNRRFEGFPVVRYDVGVDYDWGLGAPADAMVRDRWSARWDTCIVVTTEVTLQLRLTSDDASKLILDDVLLIKIGGPARRKARVRLHRGMQHLRVDFQEGQGKAVVRLRGLNFEGTDAYHFERPILDGDDVHCEEPAPLAVSPSPVDGPSR